jgi:steroid delta-isomerase-like uncharacterized protein
VANSEAPNPTVDDDGPAAAVYSYIAALNRGSAEDAVSCVSEHFVNEHTSRLGESIVGRDAYRTRLSGFLTTFTGLKYEVERMIVRGGDVAVAYTMSANWRGSGSDGPIHRPFSIRGMFRFEVVDGLITHRVDYWDSAEFLRQVSDQPKR